MFDGLKSRCVILGQYIVDNGATVREAAAVYGVSKSTVHKDVREKLKYENRSLWRQVCLVLDKNKAERHLRGGEATRLKYERCRSSAEVDDRSEHDRGFGAR